MDKLLYEERGGSRLGKNFWLGLERLFSINSTWPKAKIEIHNNYINLKTWSYPIKFRKNEIDSICIYKGLFGKGIQIKHNIKGEYPFVVFWSWNVKNLLNE